MLHVTLLSDLKTARLARDKRTLVLSLLALPRPDKTKYSTPFRSSLSILRVFVALVRKLQRHNDCTFSRQA